MKRLLISLSFLIAPLVLTGQSGQNYIRTRTMTNDAGSSWIDKIDYFDGLGRLSQTVHAKAGGGGQDLVTLTEYDGAGRQEKVWLPAAIASNNGAYVATATVKSGSVSSNGGDSEPYALAVYEASPLNRVIAEYGPGTSWHSNSKAVQTTRHINGAGFECGKYTTTDDGMAVSITRSGNWPAGVLFVTRIQDEDNNVSYEFKDKLGQILLIRQVNGSVNFDTYYIYDVYGNVRAVLPPLSSDALAGNATSTESALALQKYGYLYKYDIRNRCVAKKLPGSEWIYYVYDNANRVIFSQDGDQRSRSEWSFSIPDVFGRVVLSGTCKNNLSYSANPLNGLVVVASWANTANNYKGYTVNYTLTSPSLLSVNYYDRYEFLGKNGVPGTNTSDFGFEKRPDAGYPQEFLTGPTGSLTGTITQAPGSADLLYSVSYYDTHGRLILGKSTNHLGGREKEFFAYTFDGLPDKRFHEHSVSGVTKTEEYLYTYDTSRRLKATSHKWNGNPAVVLSDNTYDALGRLQTGKTGGILTTTYAYDVRSRLTRQSDTRYTQNMAYTYGSNIQWMSWLSGSATQKYEFAYDGLSRLTSAAYTAGSGNYATSYTYDKHGNPSSIQRYGMTSNGVYGLADNLTLTYDGNQVTSVNDAAVNIPYSFSHDFKNYANLSAEYAYNLNGSMTKDLNRGISQIQYNVLNLPARIDLKSPVGEARNEYVYGGNGVKLRVVHRWNPSYSSAPVIGSGVTESSLTRTETTDYAGNYIYVNNTLKRTLTENGYIENNVYYYNVEDHLGSTRLVINQSGSPVQSTNYYPFGMQQSDATGTEGQPYKYTGKEYDQMHGLDLYDYGARFYDPGLGRFTTIDPLAEKYYSISPYAYCANNPIRFIDPTGKSWRPTYDEDQQENRTYNGYEWIQENKSYDENGNLLPGLYAQAIFFSDNKTFDPFSKYNIGSSTATVYKADGTTEKFNASTLPSDQDIFATLPEGIYHATVGKHKGLYTALKMSDINKNGKIELGTENPAFSDGRTYATGINIHQPGQNNLTGYTRKNIAVSQGCLLIDRNHWSDFIAIFNIASQKSNIISVSVSRTISSPVNINREPAFNFYSNGFFKSYFFKYNLKY